MLKVMMLMKRKPGLSMTEFIERYESIHVPLAEKHATKIKHYERHYLHPGRHVMFGDEVAEPEYDVITELWYDDMAAFAEQQEGLLRRGCARQPVKQRAHHLAVSDRPTESRRRATTVPHIRHGAATHRPAPGYTCGAGRDNAALHGVARCERAGHRRHDPVAAAMHCGDG